MNYVSMAIAIARSSTSYVVACGGLVEVGQQDLVQVGDWL